MILIVRPHLIVAVVNPKVIAIRSGRVFDLVSHKLMVSDGQVIVLNSQEGID